MSSIARIRKKYRALRRVLNERTRRLWADAEAEELGWGGITAVAKATGMPRATIERGWLKAIFLMFQSFVSSPTAMREEYATNPLAVSLVGVVMAVNTLLFIALHAYILRRLIKPELVDAPDPHIIRKSFVSVFSYLIGAAAAWFIVQAAFLMYLLTPLFFIVPPTRRSEPNVAADAR